MLKLRINIDKTQFIVLLKKKLIFRMFLFVIDKDRLNKFVKLIIWNIYFKIKIIFWNKGKIKHDFKRIYKLL